MPKRYPTREEKQAYCARDLNKLLGYFGRSLRVRITLSQMLAGPCGACLLLEGAEMPAAIAPLLPLSDCGHFDQCGCLYELVPGSVGL